MPQQHTTPTSPRREALSPAFRALTRAAWREHGIDLRRADHCPSPRGDLVAAWAACKLPPVLTIPGQDGVRAHVIYHPSAPLAAVRRALAHAIAGGGAA